MPHGRFGLLASSHTGCEENSLLQTGYRQSWCGAAKSAEKENGHAGACPSEFNELRSEKPDADERGGHGRCSHRLVDQVFGFATTQDTRRYSKVRGGLHHEVLPFIALRASVFTDSQIRAS
jgi:hypothetical protein